MGRYEYTPRTIDDDEIIFDTQTGDRIEYMSEVCDLLNKQDENIKELEKDYSSYKKIVDINREYYILKLDYAFKQIKNQNNIAIKELEKLRNEIIIDQIDDGYTDKSVDLYYLTERITARINELRGEK